MYLACIRSRSIQVRHQSNHQAKPRAPNDEDRAKRSVQDVRPSHGLNGVTAPCMHKVYKHYKSNHSSNFVPLARYIYLRPELTSLKPKNLYQSSTSTNIPHSSPGKMSPKPHVEIAAIIPDEQGRIVIGKRKGKGGEGTAYEIHELTQDLSVDVDK